MSALTTFNDGVSHTVHTALNQVLIAGSTTVSFLSNSDAIGDNSFDDSGGPAVIEGVPGIQSSGSTFTVNGDDFDGGDDTTGVLGAGAGIVSIGDAVTISGGSIMGGNGVLNGATGALISNPTALSVTGGTVTGGNASAGWGGPGLVVVLSGSMAYSIGGSALAVSGGTGTTANGASLAVGASGSSSLTVAGGVYGGFIALQVSGTASVVFTGSGLAFSSGTLSGTLSDGSAISCTVMNTGATLSHSGSGSSVTFTA